MSKILIVGEAWGQREAIKGQPFVGPSGAMLNAFLSSAGLDRRDVYLTNVFNFQPPGNNLKMLTGPRSEGISNMPAIESGKYIRREYAGELARLSNEIIANDPNVIAALGGTACWALLHNRKIRSLRGAPIETVGIVRPDGRPYKVLPTYHPAAVLREYKLRPIVFADFKKVARESAFPEVRRPQRTFWLCPTIVDLLEFERRYIRPAESLSVDIETKQRTITCIGFAPNESVAIVIPFYSRGAPDGNYWKTHAEEVQAWKIVRRWLSFGKACYGQNFLYDANYLWAKNGIPVRHVADDTMLMAHAQQPEMEKSLGFLGSIHTDEPAWKFMRSQAETLKKED